MKVLQVIAILGAALSILSPIAAQQLIYRLEAQPDEYGFGNGVLALGDVSGDGVPDFAVVATIRDNSDPSFQIPPIPPKVLVVYDSASGERLYRIDIPKEFYTTSVVRRKVAAVGDLNGDGSSDYLVGIPGTGPDGHTGIVRVHNGSDGTLIREHRETLGGDVGGSLFGSQIAGLGDTNGDQVPDYAILRGPAGGFPAELDVFTSVWSGVDGTEIATFQSPADTVLTGVAPAKDWNGDDVPDILATVRPTGKSGPVQCFVVSGAARGEITLDVSSETILAKLQLGNAWVDWTFSKSPVADVDADGTFDLLVNLADTNTVVVISGRTGATLHNGPPGEGSTRYSVAPLGLGDIDRDGHDDIAYGQSTWRSGNLEEVHMSVYSGRTFQPILRIYPTFPVTRSYSEAVDVLGDINHDGYPELLIGVGRRHSRSHPTDFRGYVEVVSLLPPRGPIPNLHSIKRVESSNPFLQRWQLDWFSTPGTSYNVDLSGDLKTWFPGALQEPVQTLGSSGRAFVEVPNTWDTGYFRVREETP